MIKADEGAEFLYYFYTMNNFGWKPDDWLALTRREKGMVIAGIDIRVKEEERAQKQAEREAKAKHH